MNKVLTLELTAETAAELEEIVKDLIAEMQRAGEKMKRDKEEIDRLKAETRAILTQLKAA